MIPIKDVRLKTQEE